MCTNVDVRTFFLEGLNSDKQLLLTGSSSHLVTLQPRGYCGGTGRLDTSVWRLEVKKHSLLDPRHIEAQLNVHRRVHGSQRSNIGLLVC